MNYFKSGWSYLSSSFTQSDPNESTNDLDVSESQAEPTEEGAVESLATRAWVDPNDAENSNDDDLAEFADAVDNSKEQYAGDADAQLQTSSANSRETFLESSEMPEVRAHFNTADMEESETAVSAEKVDVDHVGSVDIIVDENRGPDVMEKVPEAEDETKQPANGYSSPEASDSDDSGEFIPPPTVPVGIPTNTENQLNEIINNLGKDLDILTLEEEHHLEQTLPGENTLFVTAFDHTVCSSPPGDDTPDVTIDADINFDGKISRDSAIVSSSKSSVCDVQSLELNETNSQISENNRPSTPLVASDTRDHSLNETTSEQPFATSVLDVTVEEVEADLTDKVTEQENIINPQPLEKEQPPARVESSQQEGKTEPVNSIEHTVPDHIDEVILDLDINSITDIKNSDPGSERLRASKVSTENQREIILLEEDASATSEPNSGSGTVENLSPELPTTQKTMDDPADDIPTSHAAYTIDYDDLDSFNPFQSSRAICNSPDLPSKSFPGTEVTQPPPVMSDTPNEQPTAIIESNHMKDTDTDIALPIANASATPTKPISAMLEELPTKVSNQNDDSVSNEVLIPESAKIMDAEPVVTRNQKSAFELPVSKAEIAHDNEDGEPIIPKGSYAIDFENLDNMDPFKTSKGLQNSPTKPKSIDFANIDDIDPFKSNKTLSFSPPKSPVKNNIGLLKSMTNNESSDILPEPEKKKSTENDITSNETITVAADLENVDPGPQKKLAKKPVLGAARKKVARPKSLKKKLPPVKSPDPDPPAEGEEDIILPKGSYTFNFDELDSINPFVSSKAISNSPTKTSSGSSLAPNIPKLEEKPVPVEDSPGKESSVDQPELPIKTEPLFAKKPVLGAARKKVARPKSLKKKSPPVKSPDPDPPADVEEDINLPKGSYTFNFDDLDSINPFMSSKAISNSPTKTASGSSFTLNILKLEEKPVPADPPELPIKTEPLITDEMPKNDRPKSSDDSTHETVKKETEAVKEDLKETSPVKAPEESKNGEDEILVSKGSYNLDFDNLDALDPFKSSKGLANSPTTINSDNSAKVDPFLSSKTISNSPITSPDETHAKVDAEIPKQQDKGYYITEAVPAEDQPKPLNPDDGTNKQPVKKTGPVKKKTKRPSPVKAPPTESNNEEDEIPISKGSYNLDFDNLDALDPFKSAKGIANSPTETKPSGFPIEFDNLNFVDPSNAMNDSLSASPHKPTPKADLEPEDKATSDDTKQGSFGSSTGGSKEPGATKLENEKKPQIDKKPKKKSSGLARKKLLKPGVRARPSQPVTSAGDDPPPLPKGAYNLDFDNFDAMDPFKSSKGLSNSPTKESTPPVSGCSMTSGDLDSIDPFKPKKSMMNSPPASTKSSQPGEAQSDATVSDALEEYAMREKASVTSASDVDSAIQATDETAYLSAATAPDASAAQDVDPAAPSQEQALDYKQLQQQEFDKLNEDEEFFPASSVFQDSASLAYLDKLGGAKTLTASDLRKQSLYVKFDPLVSGSPSKLIDQQISQKSNPAGGDATNVIIDLKAQGHVVVFQEPQAASSAANVSAGFDNHTSMDPYNQSYLSQQSYNSAPSTLKYTQADLQSALRKAEQEWDKERNERKTKQEIQRMELEQMSNVVKEYDRLFAEMSANGSRNGMLTREQQLLKAEHEQSAEDMTALERSHEDLCRRYNRLKAVVAQFKQNEDILKKSTTEMMEEARATEQKYVSLKVKADEEIKKANNELQFVKANALQEVSTAQAQLKMLELKCESLQSQIRDCTRENEELTKLCDDLIACSKQGE